MHPPTTFARQICLFIVARTRSPHDAPLETGEPAHSAPNRPLSDQDRQSIRSIRSSSDATPQDIIRSLLDFGANRLDVSTGYVTRIHPGPGIHVITSVSTSASGIQAGQTHDLADTFCREVVARGGPFSLHNVRTQGWDDDPAHRTLGMDCYLGTKVLTKGQLFGTLCFTDPSPRASPFTDEERALVQHLAHQIAAVLPHCPEQPPTQSPPDADLLRRVQEVSQLGGWELEVEGRTLTWTQETYRILDLPLSHSPSPPAFRPFIPEDAYDAVQSAVSRCEDEKIPFDLEVPLDTAQGHRRWVRIRGVPQLHLEEVSHITGTIQDITAHHEVESELAMRHNQFRRLVENAHAIVFLLDAEGTIQVLEGDDLDALGLEPGGPVGTSIYDLYADTPEMLSLVDRALSGEAVDTEVEVKGTVLDIWFAPYHDDAGSVSGTVGMAADITAQKEQQRELHDTQHRYQALVDHFPGGVFLYNEELECILAGGEGLSETDQSPEDIIGASPHNRYPDEISNKLVAHLEKSLAGQKCEFKQTYRGRTYRVQTLPLHPTDGTNAACMAVSFDVTEQVRQAQALQESHRRLRLALESADAGTFIYDLASDKVTWDERSLEIYGFDADTPQRVEASTLDPHVIAEDLERLDAVFDEAVADRSDYTVTYRIRRPDGELRFVTSHGTVLCDETGTPDRVVGINRDVTERKRREMDLQEERDLLDRVFQTSPTAIAILNAEGRFVRISNQAKEILGIDTETVTQRVFNDPDWTLSRPDGSPFPDEELPFTVVKETGETVQGMEHAIEWPDGTRRLLSVSGAPLHDAEGNFQGAVFHLDDITERRNAKRQLHRSEQRFRGIFNNAALGIALVNETGTLLAANPALERMTGYERDQLVGMHFGDFTHPDDVTEDQQLYDALIAGEHDQYQIEKRFIRKNGEVFWGRLTVSHQMGPDGPQIVGMVEDIDAEKQSKQHLRLFRKMVEHTKDPIVLSTSEPSGAEIQFVNKAFTEVTGYTSDEAVGATASILRGPETDLSVIEDLRDRLQNGEPAEAETVNYRKDGTPFVNHWNVAPIRDDDGEITHLVSVQRDVTEQRRMQERLLEVQEEERRRIDQELHDEMGGLLTSLQMTVDLARMEMEDPDTERLDEIEDLVEQVSATARSVSRKLYPGALPDDGLRDGLTTIAKNMEEHHGLTVDLRIHLDDGVRFSSLIERTTCWIIHEALTNVSRHADTTDARVCLSTTDQHLLLHVIDDGRGFSPEAQTHDDSLGLEGIRRRVERLGGDLNIDTAPGEGTHLSATLPHTISSVPS